MEDFDQLPAYIKAEIVFKESRLVKRINHQGKTIALHEMHGHFLEVFYSFKGDKIENICLANSERLQLYCPTLKELG